MPQRVPTAPATARTAPGRNHHEPRLPPQTGRVGTAPHKAARPSPYAAPVATAGGSRKLPAVGSKGSGSGSRVSSAATGTPGGSPSKDHGGHESVPSIVTQMGPAGFEEDEAYGAVGHDLQTPADVGGSSARGANMGASLGGRAPPLVPNATAAGSNITPEERLRMSQQGTGSGYDDNTAGSSGVNIGEAAVAANPHRLSREALSAALSGADGGSERPTSSRQSPPRQDPLRLPSATNVDGESVSADTLIRQYDALRSQCVDEGRLLEAQRCLDEVRSLARHHGERVARELKAPKSTDFAKRVLQERHRQQMLKFTSLWEGKMSEFERQAHDAKVELRQRRQRENEDLEDVIRESLDQQRPHFSSLVVGTRKELAKLIRNGKYAEAHRLKATLEAMEEKEQTKFHELQSVKFAQQTRALKRRFVTEVSALRMRVENDREQLIGQRQNDHETLMQRQANEIIAFEQRVKTSKAKALRDIDRRIRAIDSGEGVKPVDLRVFDRIAENALADVVGAPPGQIGGQQGPSKGFSASRRTRTSSAAADSPVGDLHYGDGGGGGNDGEY